MDWAPLHRAMFPELECFECEQTSRLALRKAFKVVHMRAWSVFAGVVGVAIAILAKELAPTFTRQPLAQVALVAFACTAPAYSALWMLRTAIQACLRRELNAAGNPTCLECGYDLRGQVELRCSECGKPFERNAEPSKSGKG